MKDYGSIVDRLKGPLVPVMPAFNEDESLDIESTCKWIDWLVNSGIKLFWTTYGTTHYMCLTDAEITELTKAVAEVTRGRAIFIAGTNFHWPISKCAEFLEYAANCGVDIVKLQVDWRWNPNDDMVLDFYRKLGDVSPLPLFAYTLAASGATGMTNALLKRILDLPQFVGMKNDSGDFYEHCEYLRTVRLHGARFVPMTGGTMMSFLHGRKFGAQAFATAAGLFAPQVPIAFNRYLDDGEEEKAVAIVREHGDPSLYELAKPLGLNNHWALYHTALKLLGHFKTDLMRFPMQTCDQRAVEAVRSFLGERGIL